MAKTIKDFAFLARQKLGAEFCDSVFGDYAFEDLPANKANKDAFARVKLIPRVLCEQDPITATTILGNHVSSPIMIGSIGALTRFHPDGELAVARAAAKAGAMYLAGTGSGFSIERIAEEAPTGQRWFQLYFFSDLGLTESLIRRAESAGVAAIAITVCNMRHIQRLPFDEQLAKGFHSLTLGNFIGEPGGEAVKYDFLGSWKHDLNWRDIEWVRSKTKLPIVLKGVMSPSDAEVARKHGLDGLIVSNHGGQALQEAAGTFDALSGVVEAAGEVLEVYLDGGIRSGADVVKALARGAKAVLIGRAHLWGLVAGGETGVSEVLQILGQELVENMGMCGMSSLKDIGPSLLWERDHR